MMGVLMYWVGILSSGISKHSIIISPPPVLEEPLGPYILVSILGPWVLDAALAVQEHVLCHPWLQQDCKWGGGDERIRGEGKDRWRG